MDNLDRMYRHLVRTIRARFPQYLSQPFDVAELPQTVLPYRLYRRELGLETNEDYEITLTELLSGARDYLIVDDRMRDVLCAELASTNPDPSAFKQFAGSRVALSPAALRSLEVGRDEDALTAPAATAASAVQPVSNPATPVTAAAPASPPPVARPTAPASTSSSSSSSSSQPLITPRSIVPQAGDRCRACDEQLPAGRAITFCPHCGQNVTTTNCPACGSELEIGWKFCPVCGRPAGR